MLYFSKTRNYQSGDKSGDPWHVLSNPNNPELCSVLALAKYILSNPYLLNGNCPLFTGKNQYDRFIKIFHRVIHENKETFYILGVEEHLLGFLFIMEGSKNSVLVCMYVLSPYGVYLLEGLLEHGPSKGLVHPLLRVQ